MNTLKVSLLLAGLTALLITFGHIVGSQMGGASGSTLGIGLMVLVSAAMSLGTYWFSDKIVLKMTGALPADPVRHRMIFAMTERISQRAGIPVPKLYVVPDPSPNAFATGRNPKHGVVAVNEGLLHLLDRDELEGVIAHEIAHIRHRDTLTSAVTATIAGAISSLANIAMFASMFGGGSDEEGPHPLVLLLMTLVAPIAAMLVQFAVSRSREYEADRSAAYWVGRPDGLQKALLKLEQGARAIPSSTMQPSTAHLAIVNPLSGGGFSKLFSTHPPIADRVRKLEELRHQI